MSELVERIAEVVAEGDGFWSACTGCQESVDGCVSTTDYPYDPAFKCQPGGGCGECGGIGVTWTPADFYDGYAEFSKEYEWTRENLLAALGTLAVVNGEIMGQQTAVDAIMTLSLPADVRGLVVAARELLDGGFGGDGAAELLTAVEAFASRVPYADQPDDEVPDAA